MSSDEKDRAGLGKVIYSVNEQSPEDKPTEKRVENAEVQEADEESFPASDPPGYSGGKATAPTREEGDPEKQ